MEVHGIPLHGWSISNLEKICSAWGEVVEVDEEMMDPREFKTPQAIIDTESFKNIQDWAVLEIEGRRYDVLIQELEMNAVQGVVRNHTESVNNPDPHKENLNFNFSGNCNGQDEASQSHPTSIGAEPILSVRWDDRIGSSVDANQKGSRCQKGIAEEAAYGEMDREECGTDLDEEEAHMRVLHIGAQIQKVTLAQPSQTEVESDRVPSVGPSEARAHSKHKNHYPIEKPSCAQERSGCVPDSLAMAEKVSEKSLTMDGSDEIPEIGGEKEDQSMKESQSISGAKHGLSSIEPRRGNSY